MKKLFTLFAVALMAIAVNAQTQPLYTVTTTVTNDPEWGDDYAAYFAFRGTQVNIDVYDENYVIVRNWTGAEGCDLKITYDPAITVDDDCMGNITAMTVYINGEEQTPLTYTKDDGYSYIDLATGLSDYSVCSTSLNDDGTTYYSFVEVDKENREGYVFLFAYFMTADYEDQMEAMYYFTEWGGAGESQTPGFYGTYEAEMDDAYDETMTGFPAQTGVTVDAYNDHVVVHALAGVEGYDMVIYFNDDETVASITPPTKTGEMGATKTSGYCSIYTGLDDANWKSFQAYIPYSYATADEEGGYVLLYGYDYTSSIYGYYCLSWGEDEEEEDAVSSVRASMTVCPAYNLAGQRVHRADRGIFIIDGKKVVR